MMLRGVKPSLIQKRLKAFFYGAAKVGKTTTAIQFPKPYLIDTEKGAEHNQYVKLLEKQEGVVFRTTEYDEILKEVRSLLTVKHDFKTLIIDSFTIIYDNLLHECALKLSNPRTGSDGTESGRNYLLAGRYVKRLFDLLIKLDMNVIITAYSKIEYGSSMQVIGKTFDCYKKMDHLVDLILEIEKRGSERIAIVKGTRIDGFNECDQFAFSYENIKTRYDAEILEKESINIELATKEEILNLRDLLSINKTSQEVIDFALKRAEVSELDDLPRNHVLSWINKLQDKISKNNQQAA